jgi:exopolysaccharide biosynthesis polyprenyl glycosylphosphotransferase
MRSDLERDTPGGTPQNLYRVQKEALPISDGHGSQTAELGVEVEVEHPDAPDSHSRDDLRRTGETKGFGRAVRPLAVVVGINAAGGIIVEELRRAQRPGMNILGYISEHAGACAEAGSQKNGLPILGGRDVLSFLIEDGLIDIIIMTVDYKTHPELFQQAIEATQRGISVVPMAMVYERMWGKVPIEHIGDQWYAALPSEIRFRPLYLCWRKAMDVTFALVGMVVLLLLMPVLTLLIYLESPGPVFYSQERLGYQGRKFFIHKFRSMRTDAECAGHPRWASQDDPRVMRVGRFLRATHLDELPQVLNILRGDMSLIGPRPERAAFVSQLAKTIPFYLCRLSVKPGLTGWAQVKYSYGSSDRDALEKLQYDLYYIKHQSLILDIRVILMSVVEMVLCRGR